MSLDPETQGDARTKRHAECCKDECPTEGICQCWCHLVLTNLDGTEREDAEALRTELRRLSEDSRRELRMRKTRHLN
jgi:hypothetical protein